MFVTKCKVCFPNTFKSYTCPLPFNAIPYGNAGGGDDYTMPHDKLAHLSGNRHAASIKGSLFEHDPKTTANPTNNPVVNEYARKMNGHHN